MKVPRALLCPNRERFVTGSTADIRISLESCGSARTVASSTSPLRPSSPSEPQSSSFTLATGFDLYKADITDIFQAPKALKTLTFTDLSSRFFRLQRLRRALAPQANHLERLIVGYDPIWETYFPQDRRLCGHPYARTGSGFVTGSTADVRISLESYGSARTVASSTSPLRPSSPSEPRSSSPLSWSQDAPGCTGFDLLNKAGTSETWQWRRLQLAAHGLASSGRKPIAKIHEPNCIIYTRRECDNMHGNNLASFSADINDIFRAPKALKTLTFTDLSSRYFSQGLRRALAPQENRLERLIVGYDPIWENYFSASSRIASGAESPCSATMKLLRAPICPNGKRFVTGSTADIRVFLGGCGASISWGRLVLRELGSGTDSGWPHLDSSGRNRLRNNLASFNADITDIFRAPKALKTLNFTDLSSRYFRLQGLSRALASQENHLERLTVGYDPIWENHFSTSYDEAPASGIASGAESP
ncbi:hypothetical protein MMC07_008692 [Pseudocyphellaria aurata]|nr:hypothetical protein [Pseudocyphellaria aurata]